MTSSTPIGVEVGAVYELIGPDGSRAVINDPGDPDFAGFLDGEDGVSGLERAGVRESAEDFAEGHGRIQGRNLYGGLAFTFKGKIPPDPRMEAGEYTETLVERTRNAWRNPLQEGPAGTANSTYAATAGVSAGHVDDPLSPSGRALSVSTAASAASVYIAPSYANATTTFNFGMAAGETWTVAADVAANDIALASASSASWGVGILYRRPDNVYISTYAPVTQRPTVAGQYVRQAATVTIPADSTAALCRFYGRTNTAGAEVRFTQITLVRGATDPGPIYAGLLPGGFPLRTSSDPATAETFLDLIARTPLPETLVWARRQDRLLAATNAMDRDGLVRWKPSHAPPVQVRFRQQQPTRITGRRPKNFLIAGSCENHTVESQEVVSSVIDLTPSVDTAGLRSPMTSPLGSGAETIGNGSAENIGSADAWPTITFRGPITNPSIRSLRFGREVRLSCSLADGEELVLVTDPHRRAILLGGTIDRYELLDWESSWWFPIAPGPNNLRVGASSFSAGASVTVAFRHAWG